MVLTVSYVQAESISATISGPGKGLVNEKLSYSVDVKEEWTIDEAKWNFGDGTSSSGSSVSHKYAGVGAFSVSVKVDAHREQTDADGTTTETSGSDSDSTKVTVKGKLSISADPKTLPADGESTSTISVATVDGKGNSFIYKKEISLSLSESGGGNNNDNLPNLPNLLPLPSLPTGLGGSGSGGESSSNDVLSLGPLKTENGSRTATATAGTTAGTAKIKASGDYLESASCKIKVKESKDLKLSISASPDILPADGKSQTALIIKVLDENGHIDTTYNGSVSLRSSKASALKVPNSLSMKDGQGTAKATAGTSAANVTVKASGDGLAAASCKIVAIKMEIIPDCKNIGIKDTMGITANIQPSGRTAVWSIKGSSHGCSVKSAGNLTANFTAGSENAAVAVKACDSVCADCCDTAAIKIVGSPCHGQANASFSCSGKCDCSGQDGCVELPVSSEGEGWDAEFKVCYDTDSKAWRIYVSSITFYYTYGVCSGPRVVISSAYDSDVTEDNWRSILYDFSDTVYDDYFAIECVKAWENTNVKNLKNAVAKQWNIAKKKIDALKKPFVCGSADTPAAVYNDLLTGVVPIIKNCHSNAKKDYDFTHEAGCYEAHMHCFSGLRQAIRERAKKEGWGSCSY